jgi:hypothetical protein
MRPELAEFALVRFGFIGVQGKKGSRNDAKKNGSPKEKLIGMLNFFLCAFAPFAGTFPCLRKAFYGT